MHVRFSSVLLFTASAMGYQITVPNTSQGWTTSGSQPVKWQRVSTDAANFTAVLTNVDRQVMPINNQVLSALVDGNLLSTNMNPPSGGFPTGDGFRLNFVKDVEDMDTIFAQSDEFSIKADSQASKSTSSAQSVSQSYPMNSTPTTLVAQTTGTSPNMATSVSNNDGSGTATAQATGTHNGALVHDNVQAALLGVFSFIGIMLA